MKGRRQSVTYTEEQRKNYVVTTTEEITSSIDGNKNISELDYTVTIRR